MASIKKVICSVAIAAMINNQVFAAPTRRVDKRQADAVRPLMRNEVSFDSQIAAISPQPVTLRKLMPNDVASTGTLGMSAAEKDGISFKDKVFSDNTDALDINVSISTLVETKTGINNQRNTFEELDNIQDADSDSQVSSEIAKTADDAEITVVSAPSEEVDNSINSPSPTFSPSSIYSPPPMMDNSELYTQDKFPNENFEELQFQIENTLHTMGQLKIRLEDFEGNVRMKNEQLLERIRSTIQTLSDHQRELQRTASDFSSTVSGYLDENYSEYPDSYNNNSDTMVMEHPVFTMLVSIPNETPGHSKVLEHASQGQVTPDDLTDLIKNLDEQTKTYLEIPDDLSAEEVQEAADFLNVVYPNLLTMVPPKYSDDPMTYFRQISESDTMSMQDDAMVRSAIADIHPMFTALMSASSGIAGSLEVFGQASAGQATSENLRNLVANIDNATRTKLGIPDNLPGIEFEAAAEYLNAMFPQLISMVPAKYSHDPLTYFKVMPESDKMNMIQNVVQKYSDYYASYEAFEDGTELDEFETVSDVDLAMPEESDKNDYDVYTTPVLATLTANKKGISGSSQVLEHAIQEQATANDVGNLFANLDEETRNALSITDDLSEDDLQHAADSLNARFPGLATKYAPKISDDPITSFRALDESEILSIIE